jgi:ABC-type Zn uptake system ZnuABC Zn-binding protein ZnuA
MKKNFIFITLGLLSLLLSACTPFGSTPVVDQSLQVVAAEAFLADIAQNVAGERLTIIPLIPAGVDPHTFTPTPQDLALITESDVLILNGAGLEEALLPALDNVDGKHLVIEASAGLESRPITGDAANGHDVANDSHGHEEGDPHFWLDPNLAIYYVETIRSGLTQVDPAGAEIYAANATAYIAKLQTLDRWIREQIGTIPPDRRLLVTNHESFGYFADRYGLKVIGTLSTSVSAGAAPSAKQIAALVDQIRATGAPAIFLEQGVNPQLAEQVAAETGVQVVTGLYTHSLTASDGEAPTYIQMLRFNVTQIVTALR